MDFSKSKPVSTGRLCCIGGEVLEAVIVTGGKGSRLTPFTKVLPKGLLPVGEQPILEIIVKQLRNYGFTHLHMACGYLASLIQTYFGDGGPWGVNIDYVIEDKELGTIGPLKKISCLSGRPILVINCDVLTTLDFRKLMEFHNSGTSLLTIASQKKTVPMQFGVLQTKGDRVTDFVEKPTRAEHVSMGIYVMSQELVEQIPDEIYYDMPDLILQRLASGEEVRHFENDAFWLDIGRYEDFVNANELYPQIEKQLFPGHDHGH